MALAASLALLLCSALAAQPRSDADALARAVDDLEPLTLRCPGRAPVMHGFWGVSLSARRSVDWAWIEVGLRERLDAELANEPDPGRCAWLALAYAEFGTEASRTSVCRLFDRVVVAGQDVSGAALDRWALALGRAGGEAALSRLTSLMEAGARPPVAAQALGWALLARSSSTDVGRQALDSLQALAGEDAGAATARDVFVALGLVALGQGDLGGEALARLTMAFEDLPGSQRTRQFHHVLSRARLEPGDREALAAFWRGQLEPVEPPGWFPALVAELAPRSGWDPRLDPARAGLAGGDVRDFEFACLALGYLVAGRASPEAVEALESELGGERPDLERIRRLGDFLFRQGTAMDRVLRRAAAERDGAVAQAFARSATRYASHLLLGKGGAVDRPVHPEAWIRLAGACRGERRWWHDLAALQDPLSPDGGLERMRQGLFERAGGVR